MRLKSATAAAMLVWALGSAAWAEPKTYEIDPSHTQAYFTVDRFGFTSILGAFATTEGAIVLDEDAPERSSVTARVQTAGVWTADGTRDQHVLGPRWLNAAAFPTIEFVSTQVRLTGQNTAQVAGNLTLLGVTRPVNLEVRLNKIGVNPASPRRTAGFTISGEIDRRDFGMTVAPGLIGNMVTIRIEALALEQAP